MLTVGMSVSKSIPCVALVLVERFISCFYLIVTCIILIYLQLKTGIIKLSQTHLKHACATFLNHHNLLLCFNKFCCVCQIRSQKGLEIRF